MNTAPVSISRALTLELIDASGAATPLAAELCYDKKDPYAVAACFRTGVDRGALGVRPRPAGGRALRTHR